MKERLKKYYHKLESNFPFVIIVWSIGFYTLRQSAKQFNLDRPQDIHPMHLLFLGIAFFFILLPFIKTIKIGKYIELERNIKQTKEEVNEFKSEIRQSVQMLSSSVSASIGNLNNQVTIHLPGVEELREEKEKIKKVSQDSQKFKLADIKEELVLQEEDDIMALARTRIRLEYLLRRILGKKTSIKNVKNERELQFIGLTELFEIGKKQHLSLEQFTNSFKYVSSICNAAIHGQRISTGQTLEALDLGARIIRELQIIDEDKK